MKAERKRFEQQLWRMRCFWDSMKDTVHGGFYGRVDGNGSADAGADKGTILMSRILWFYSRLAVNGFCSAENRGELLNSADHVYLFIKEHCLDPLYGGAFEMVHCDGTMADERKNAYTQSFVMLAVSAYAYASGSKEARLLARQLEDLLEEKYWDGYGYRESLSRSFEKIYRDASSLAEVPVTDKETYTLGTVIQLLESHLMLYEALTEKKEKEAVQDKILRLIKLLTTAFNEKENGLLYEYASVSCRPDNYISCGHNAIAALLYDRACAGNEFSQRIIKLICESFLDPEDGAMDYEIKEAGWNKTRVWWAQADSAAVFYHAHAKSPDESLYLDACERILSFVDEHMTDPKTGEWTEYMRDLEPDQDLVHSWKGPYHTGRMCFEILRDMGD